MTPNPHSQPWRKSSWQEGAMLSNLPFSESRSSCKYAYCVCLVTLVFFTRRKNAQSCQKLTVSRLCPLIAAIDKRSIEVLNVWRCHGIGSSCSRLFICKLLIQSHSPIKYTKYWHRYSKRCNEAKVFSSYIKWAKKFKYPISSHT